MIRMSLSQDASGELTGRESHAGNVRQLPRTAVARLAGFVSVCLLLAPPLWFFGCGGGDGSAPTGGSADVSSSDAPAPGSRGTIGVTLLTFENPFFKVIADNIEAEAARQGYSVVALSADEDPAKQSQQVADFVVQKVAAIVISPAETRSVLPAVQRAAAAGIPVFTVDIPIESDEVEVISQIATDNKGGGRLAAEAMIEAIGSGKVAILHYQQAESCRLRVEGFLEVIAEHNSASDEKIEIVATLESGAAKDGGLQAAADAMQANPDLRGIFAINDPAALGAVAAVETAKRTGQVVIVGFDGQPEGKQAIKEGTIYADPIQFPDRMGKLVVESIIAHLKGKEVPAKQLIPTELYRQADAAADPELK
ncbi:MAG: substrate-binding domain-containing protein [Planctomycetaceae bacterium]